MRRALSSIDSCCLIRSRHPCDAPAESEKYVGGEGQPPDGLEFKSQSNKALVFTLHDIVDGDIQRIKPRPKYKMTILWRPFINDESYRPLIASI